MVNTSEPISIEKRNEYRATVPQSEGSSFIERLAKQLGATANVTSVFGEPVERDGTTVIPVARFKWGFGGGEGTGTESAGAGSGGGGGMTADPVGFIVISKGRARYRPLSGFGKVFPFVAGVVVGSIALSLVGRRRAGLSQVVGLQLALAIASAIRRKQQKH